MRILVWHDHGGWMDAFVRGNHEYLVPVDERGSGGRLPSWPRGVRDVRPSEMRELDFDVVVMQRLEEVELVERLTARRPGRDVPAVFVEHNTPQADIPNTRHPFAGRSDILIAHVSYFNSLMWDCADAPTTVIEHGIVDRGYAYTGTLARSAAVINEPVRRWRVTGTDLLRDLSEPAPVDVFGMDVGALAAKLGLPSSRITDAGNWSPDELHVELPQRRLYLHPMRWTSLGLSLLEAMMAGMPVVGVESTEIHRAVPDGAGVISANVGELQEAIAWLMEDAEAAQHIGRRARDHVLANYGLAKYLDAWDAALAAWTQMARHR
jgi:hypothetical protein